MAVEGAGSAGVLPTRFQNAAGAAARPASIRPAGLELSQLPAKAFDLTFIDQLLALGQFDQLEDLFHLRKGLLERFDDIGHIVGRLEER